MTGLTLSDREKAIVVFATVTTWQRWGFPLGMVRPERDRSIAAAALAAEELTTSLNPADMCVVRLFFEELLPRFAEVSP